MAGDLQRVPGLGMVAFVPFAFTTTAETVEVSTKGLRKFRSPAQPGLAGSAVDPQDAVLSIDETYDATTGIYTAPANGMVTLTRQASGSSGLSGVIMFVEA